MSSEVSRSTNNQKDQEWNPSHLLAYDDIICRRGLTAQACG